MIQTDRFMSRFHRASKRWTVLYLQLSCIVSYELNPFSQAHWCDAWKVWLLRLFLGRAQFGNYAVGDCRSKRTAATIHYV